MGDQRSLLQIDLSHELYQIYYCDTSHRPATSSVLKAVDNFLVNVCGQPSLSTRNFHDLYVLHDKHPAVQASMYGEMRGDLPTPDQRLAAAMTRLQAARKQVTQSLDAQQKEAQQKPVSSGGRLFGLFPSRKKDKDIPKPIKGFKPDKP
jgi:hypothetical protein